MRRWRDTLTGIIYPVGVVAILLLAWEAIVRIQRIPLFLLPPPSAVFERALRELPVLAGHAWTTGYEAVIAFLLSLGIGIPAAILIASFRPVERAAYPLLVASQAIPKVTIAPLLVIWFGFGLAPKILVAFLIAFFPIVVSMVVGLKSLPPEMTHLGRSMGLGPVETFLKIRLPHALPSLFGGMQVAIALSLVGAIVGEFTGASSGLGYLLIVTIGTLDTVMMFAGVLASIVLGVILFYIVILLERVVLPWHISQRLQAGTGI